MARASAGAKCDLGAAMSLEILDQRHFAGARSRPQPSEGLRAGSAAAKSDLNASACGVEVPRHSTIFSGAKIPARSHLEGLKV